jgi:SH3-like domain-containing protein
VIGRPRRLQLIVMAGALWACYGLTVAAAASLPLPRYVSLKRPITNVRAGPGTDYPIRWIYKKQGLPVEIIAQYGGWRRIRGSDGADGWVNGALLTATRMALVMPWQGGTVSLKLRPKDKARIVARLQSRVLVRPRRCDRTWCFVTLQGSDLQGYVRQSSLWGVYPDEVIAGKSFWRSVGRIIGD